MDTKQFPARLKKSIAESFNFRQALKRLETGKAETPRSWVYEDKTPEWILDSWSKLLVAGCKKRDLGYISEWDLSKSDKFKSQGKVAPFKERQETLKEYWAHLDSYRVFESDLWKKAIRQSIRELGFNRSGSRASVEAVVARGIKEDKYNTSSGDPLFMKRRNPIAQQQAISAAKNGTWMQYDPVLGSRASMGKTGSEARWIFMFPMSVNLVEQSFQQPLQDYIRRKNIAFFAPWDGYDKVQEILSANGPRKLVKFGCDYSKMDQHFNWHHAEQCYLVIREYFKPSEWKDLYESIHYTFYCDVVAPSYLICGPHAMPSGSGWTNFLETVFNFILKNFLRLKFGIKIIIAMGIGDDQLWFIDYKGDLEKLTDFVVEQFKSVGLDANPEKQEVSLSMAAFLQRRSWSTWSPYQIEYAGVYPTIRALTSEVYPEFYHNEKEWTKNTFALRCLMIAENCKNHPCFRDFCIFIAKGNQNIVEFAKLPDAEILLIQHASKKIANFIPTYNQEKQDMDITHFESLRIVREYAMKS